MGLGITREGLAEAITDEKTRLPNYLREPKNEIAESK